MLPVLSALFCACKVAAPVSVSVIKTEKRRGTAAEAKTPDKRRGKPRRILYLYILFRFSVKCNSFRDIFRNFNGERCCAVSLLLLFLRCGAFAMPFSDLSVIRIYPPVRNHVKGKRNDRVEACFFEHILNVPFLGGAISSCRNLSDRSSTSSDIVCFDGSAPEFMYL